MRQVPVNLVSVNPLQPKTQRLRIACHNNNVTSNVTFILCESAGSRHFVKHALSFRRIPASRMRNAAKARQKISDILRVVWVADSMHSRCFIW